VHEDIPVADDEGGQDAQPSEPFVE
jgi:hypothetical protein